MTFIGLDNINSHFQWSFKVAGTCITNGIVRIQFAGQRNTSPHRKLTMSSPATTTDLTTQDSYAMVSTASSTYPIVTPPQDHLVLLTDTLSKLAQQNADMCKSHSDLSQQSLEISKQSIAMSMKLLESINSHSSTSSTLSAPSSIISPFPFPEASKKRKAMKPDSKKPKVLMIEHKKPDETKTKQNKQMKQKKPRVAPARTIKVIQREEQDLYQDLTGYVAVILAYGLELNIVMPCVEGLFLDISVWNATFKTLSRVEGVMNYELTWDTENTIGALLVRLEHLFGTSLSKVPAKMSALNNDEPYTGLMVPHKVSVCLFFVFC